MFGGLRMYRIGHVVEYNIFFAQCYFACMVHHPWIMVEYEQQKYDVLVNQIVNAVDIFISLYFFKFDFMTTNSLYSRFRIV